MTLGVNPDIKVNLLLGRSKIEKFQKVALLGITIDDKLNFKTYIENICRLAKCMRKYLSTDKAKATLCNASISSQFY